MLPPKYKSILQSDYFLPALLLLINIIIVSQSMLLSPKAYEAGGIAYPRYNNYLIFKQAFFHLIENLNLYALHPSKHHDLFKYSPTFALLMAPIAILPDWAGLLIWNLLNTFVLYFAILQIPQLTKSSQRWIVLFVLLELITSLRNTQSNALITGMIIYAFVFFEKNRPGLATLLIVGSAFIKIFGVIALILAILYPSRFRSAAYSVLWFVTLGILPALFIPSSDLIQQYHNWGELLRNDHSISLGLSVMGWLQSWFNLFGLTYKSEIVLIGLILLCLPFLQFNKYQEAPFRVAMLCSVLIWMVIFNHRAESPTFIIAVTGVAVWYFSYASQRIDHVLIVLTFIFTVLSATDLFPGNIRKEWVVPYVLKGVPCILIWIRIWQINIFPTQKGLPDA